MRSRVVETVAGLRRSLAGVRWVSTEGLHLTLRFLGPSPPTALAEMEPKLRRAAEACPPAEVRLTGLGLFPDRGSPRVLWLGVALPETVLALQSACEAAAVEAGFAPESRSFSSHLTLGRWRERVTRPELPEVDLGTARLETLVLFKSDLRPQGAVYIPLATFALGG